MLSGEVALKITIIIISIFILAFLLAENNEITKKQPLCKFFLHSKGV